MPAGTGRSLATRGTIRAPDQARQVGHLQVNTSGPQTDRRFLPISDAVGPDGLQHDCPFGNSGIRGLRCGHHLPLGDRDRSSETGNLAEHTRPTPDTSSRRWRMCHETWFPIGADFTTCCEMCGNSSLRDDPPRVKVTRCAELARLAACERRSLMSGRLARRGPIALGVMALLAGGGIGAAAAKKAPVPRTPRRHRLISPATRRLRH
jgi:hypothetical protein